MDMSTWNLQQQLDQLHEDLARAVTADARQALRNAYLSKKQGLVGKLFGQLRELSPELKRRVGPDLNVFKQTVESEFKKLEANAQATTVKPGLDLTLPGVRPAAGGLHPLTRTMNDMIEFFVRMGYDVADGPEVETCYFNFEALNTPADHPARDEGDTYYIDDDRVLRTQTSGMQIRYMLDHKPPIRMLSPGRVYRRDDDLTHSPMFHQLEGLVVGPGIHFGHLKGTLEAFARHIFGERTRIRLRPSYFPFTEPSAEVDASCPFCQSGCRVCKNSGWIEILGSGVVDPNVLARVGYDPEAVSGFAFGMGIERIAMLRYAIPDIRYLYQNDRRFLDQFRGR